MLALIVAPHPDDELLVAGPLVSRMLERGDSIHVLYMTNGDNLALDFPRRLTESVACCQMLGIPECNVHFLGYGDGWKGSHIYENRKGTCVSAVGRSETYGLAGHPEYCYVKHGVHHAYTRENWKGDVAEILDELRPDIIFCVDYDHHPDHRATSLILEEVIGEKLHRTDNTWIPIVLKTFVYAGRWEGLDDYWAWRETLPPQKGRCNLLDYELDVPYYAWSDRLRFSVPDDFLTADIRRNRMFALGACHASQIFRWYIPRICNTDCVYWLRRTDNLLFNADITATSGDARKICDFKFIDASDVSRWRVPTEHAFDNHLWIPDASDGRKAITVLFRRPVSISTCVLYFNADSQSHFRRVLVSLYSKNILQKSLSVDIGAAEARKSVVFPLAVDITSMTLAVTDSYGSSPGLCELEVFESEASPDIYSMLPWPYPENSSSCLEQACERSPHLPLSYRVHRWLFHLYRNCKVLHSVIFRKHK